MHFQCLIIGSDVPFQSDAAGNEVLVHCISYQMQTVFD